jgi:hypothetical protein
MSSLKHTHTLRKVRKTNGQKAIFQCNHPDCSWRSSALFIEGKRFQCNYCSNTFIYKPSMSRTRFPHCADCKSGRPSSIKESLLKKENLEKAQELLIDRIIGTFPPFPDQIDPD